MENNTVDSQRYSGFLLAFEPRRTRRIHQDLRLGKRVVESFSEVDWRFQHREIVLLTLTPGIVTIGGVALMEPMGGSGGTGRRKMRLTDCELFGEPIHDSLLPKELHLEQYISTAVYVTRIPVEAWELIIGRIRSLRADSAAALSRLFAKRVAAPLFFGDDARGRRLAEEGDGLGMVLRVAGHDTAPVFESMNTARAEYATSILDLLEDPIPNEPDLIYHDKPIFKRLLSQRLRHAVFGIEEERVVHVWVTDKKKLETVAGFDLLIYQAVYESALLVQYKAMELDKLASRPVWSYTLDSQLVKQLKSMNSIRASLAAQPCLPTGMRDWRLDDSPYYFKFCERTNPDKSKDSLAAGMVLGLRHLEEFISQLGQASDAAHRIGYDNCPRYFNNTEFVRLARGGWIGSDQRWLPLLSKLLMADRKAGKAAMFAIVEDKYPLDARRRGWRRWY